MRQLSITTIWTRPSSDATFDIHAVIFPAEPPTRIDDGAPEEVQILSIKMGDVVFPEYLFSEDEINSIHQAVREAAQN